MFCSPDLQNYFNSDPYFYKSNRISLIRYVSPLQCSFLEVMEFLGYGTPTLPLEITHRKNDSTKFFLFFLFKNTIERGGGEGSIRLKGHKGRCRYECIWL